MGTMRYELIPEGYTETIQSKRKTDSHSREMSLLQGHGNLGLRAQPEAGEDF